MTNPNDDKRPSAARGRFGNVIHHEAAPQQEWARDTERYGATGAELAPAIGAQDLGYAVVSLDPGKRSCPLHFHHSEEEMFFVLSGRGVVRQAKDGEEEELELGPGDCVAYPPNTGIAHQFHNKSDAPFVYLAVSNRIASDVCEYPDSNKILVRRSRTMLRREPNLEYFDGEL